MTGYINFIINSFNSTVTNREQIIEIFKQTNIRVLFTDEFLDMTKEKSLIEQLQDTIQKLEEKNKILEDEKLLLN